MTDDERIADQSATVGATQKGAVGASPAPVARASGLESTH